MATITKTSTEKNIVELQKATKELGYGIETVDMNGVSIPAFAYASEEDRQAGLRFLQMFMDGSDNSMSALHKICAVAKLGDAKIELDEEVEVDSVPMVINYKDKAIYTIYGEEIANCRELECELPAEACKLILIQKAKLTLEEDC